MKFQDFVKQAKQTQDKMQDYYKQWGAMQNDLLHAEYVGLAKNGLIKVVINGLGQIQSLNIDKQILQDSPELVADLVKEAYNSAAAKNKEIITSMMELTKNLFMYRGLDKL